jgi:hypothetical protein
MNMNSLYRISWIERISLKTPYPAVVARVGAILSQLPRGTALVLDYGGVGRGIFDMFQYGGISPIGVALTGGDSVHWEGCNTVSLAKSTLISRLVALVHSGELVVHKDLKDWAILRRELLNFRTEVTPSGSMTWNAGTGAHDDVLIATALAGWYLEGRDTPNAGFFNLCRSRHYEGGGQPPPERWVVGVDIGQSRDPTAICVASQIDRPSKTDIDDPAYARPDVHPSLQRPSAPPPESEPQQQWEGQREGGKWLADPEGTPGPEEPAAKLPPHRAWER